MLGVDPVFAVAAPVSTPGPAFDALTLVPGHLSSHHESGQRGGDAEGGGAEQGGDDASAQQ